MMIWHGILALALICAIVARLKGRRQGAFDCLLFAGALLVWVLTWPHIAPYWQFLAGGFFWLSVAALSWVVNKSPNGGKSMFAIYLALKAPCYFMAEISSGPFGFGNLWLTASDTLSILAILSAGGLEIRRVAGGLGRVIGLSGDRNSWVNGPQASEGEIAPKVGVS